MANYVVGLTGGIGSGKTAVSDRFSALGIEVADSDVASREVVAPGQPALTKIAARFGADVLQDDGTLNRALLRERIFADRTKRRWLEQLLHPLINALIADKLAAARSPYAILVNPLMQQRDPRANRILVVDVPEAVQVQRTIHRDGVDEAQARAIVASQTERTARLAFADDTIVNDGTLAALHDQVDALHERYLALARERLSKATL